MTEPLHVAPRPCITCPYAKATPAGVWDASEYEKLREYDDDWNPPIAMFHCHQENATGTPTACKGFLAVHPDAVAVRLGQAVGSVTPDQVAEPCPVEVYASGTEACEAGLVGIADPSPEALAAMAKLIGRGAGRYDDG